MVREWLSVANHDDAGAHGAMSERQRVTGSVGGVEVVVGERVLLAVLPRVCLAFRIVAECPEGRQAQAVLGG